jgi:thiopeptide-type bacteriocin biosynthesis protein
MAYALRRGRTAQVSSKVHPEVHVSPCDISDDPSQACLRDLKRLIAERDERDSSFNLNGHASSLADFLAVCARSLRPQSEPRDERCSDEVYWATSVFMRAGLEALAARPWHAGNDWIQIGIHPLADPASRGELSRQVACLARRWLTDSTVDNFFFMNKPPGMRLRFQTTAPGDSADLADVLHAEAARWRVAGLIDHIEPGVYEPETQLFGGPRSMSFVHALFTVDSLIWLDYHACRAVGGDEISPAWLVSLAVLQTLFAGLDITGWEDIGVWDRIREVTGRRLSADNTALPTYAAVAAEIRDVWSRRDQIADELSPPVKALVARHERAMLTGAAQWRSGYFGQRSASLGPRAAAAFYVIFHWNRAALSRPQQALLAESLAERMVEDGHR